MRVFLVTGYFLRILSLLFSSAKRYLCPAMEDSAYKQLLKDHRVNVTAGRVLLIRTICEAGHLMTLDEVAKEVPSIKKDNIRRTLKLFCDQKLMALKREENGAVLYEPSTTKNKRAEIETRARFYCTHCRQMFYMDNLVVPPLPLPEEWQIRQVNYSIEGICPECTAAIKSRGGRK